MSSKINYVDLDRDDLADRAEYKRKADSNLGMFCKMTRHLGVTAYRRFSSFESDAENNVLMRRISRIFRISPSLVKLINASDGLKSSGLLEGAGCTAVGRDGVIGQTMDLYDVDLSVVRESGALYITFPPYLTLMGMNEKLAFCTNYLESKTGLGIPVSRIRRSILRKKNIEGAIDYLEDVRSTNSANFLLSDGQNIVDVEMTRRGCNVHRSRNGSSGRFNAHTNHLVDEGIIEDISCPRLTKAVDMLNEGEEIGDILDSGGISIPMVNGFGSIVKVIMDVRNRTLRYKDRRMGNYEELRV